MLELKGINSETIRLEDFEFTLKGLSYRLVGEFLKKVRSITGEASSDGLTTDQILQHMSLVDWLLEQTIGESFEKVRDLLSFEDIQILIAKAMELSGLELVTEKNSTEPSAQS